MKKVLLLLISLTSLFASNNIIIGGAINNSGTMIVNQTDGKSSVIINGIKYNKSNCLPINSDKIRFSPIIKLNNINYFLDKKTNECYFSK